MEQKPAAPNPFDAIVPQNIAALVSGAGVRKTQLPALQTLVLGILAGAFIAFGALFYLVVMTGSPLGFGPARLLGGVAFSLGLILVIIAGAELFTGNNLVVMTWAAQKVSMADLLRNWRLIYVANFIGAVAIAWVVWRSGLLGLATGGVEQTLTTITLGKLGLSWEAAFWRGLLCNTLACLAVWMCFAAHTVTDKVLVIIFLISGFVAMGIEHSIANMFFLPLAWLHNVAGVDATAIMANLIPVTLGNILDGSIGVALIYWIIWLRPQ